MSKSTFDEARDRSARAAKRRRIRIFLLGWSVGAAIMTAVLVAGALLAHEPQPSPWISIGDRQPQPYALVLVAQADGDWSVAYMDDAGEFSTPCDGMRVRGVVRWMQAPERP